MKKYICAIIKDEHPYLREWLIHHLNMGFDRIFLYEDYGSKSHDGIIVSLGALKDKVELVKIGDFWRRDLSLVSGTGRQVMLYDKFLFIHKGESAWVTFIDIDEFIMLDDGENLDSFLSDFNDVPAVALFWKMYNADGNIKRQNGTVGFYNSCVNIYDSNDYKMGYIYKSIVNLSIVQNKMLSAHEAFGVVTTEKKRLHRKLSVNNNITFKRAWINHYYTRSWEDFMYKIIKRGDLGDNYRRLEDFFVYNPDMRESVYEYLSTDLPNNETPVLKKDGKTMRIYCTYHDKILYPTFIYNRLLTPYYTKNECAENKIQMFLNEFVTMRYVWHNNLKTDMVGFCHYRRQFTNTYWDENTIYYYGIFRHDQKKIFKRYGCNFILDLLIKYINDNYDSNSYEHNLIDMFNGCDVNWGTRESYVCSWEVFDKMMRFVDGFISYFENHYGLYETEESYTNWLKNVWEKTDDIIMIENYFNDFGYVKDLNKNKQQYRVIAFLLEHIIGTYLVNFPNYKIKNLNLDK